MLCILQHPKFRSEHLAKNVRRLRLLRNRLPLQTVKKHSVPIKDMKTPSTSTQNQHRKAPILESSSS
jgi:hypothetical protein